jgi:phosphoserine phosphatase RsbU/P
MRILVAEHEPMLRRMLENMLTAWGHQVIVAESSSETWRLLRGDEPPTMLVLDWLMPKLGAVEICRKIRQDPSTSNVHVIMLVSRGRTSDAFAASLNAGADDYISKPFDPEELRARVRVGVHAMQLQRNLDDLTREFDQQRTHPDQAQELLPVCTECGRMRNRSGYWQQLKSYLVKSLRAEIVPSLCPTCDDFSNPELANAEAHGVQAGPQV